MTRFNQKGSMLIQVVITAALIGVIATMLASLQSQQQKQLKALEQKSEILDLKNQLSRVMMNVDTCQCMLSGGTFNSNVTDGSQFINVTSLRSSCVSGSEVIVAPNMTLSSGVRVSAVRLADLRPSGNANEWLANWTVQWDEDSLAGPSKNLKIRQVVRVDPLSPPAARRVDSCLGTSDIQCVERGSVCAGNPNGCDISVSCPVGYTLTSCWNEEDGGSVMIVSRGTGPQGEDQCKCKGTPPSAGMCWVAQATCCRVRVN